MTYIPPSTSYQPRKKSSNVLLIVGIVGCGGFLVLCIFVVAILAAYKMGTQAGPNRNRSPLLSGTAPKRISSAPILVGPAEDGWSLYKLSDFGVILALPKMPKVSNLQPDEWGDVRDDIEAYSGRETDTGSARVSMEGYLYKDTFPNRDDWVIREDLSWRHRGTDYKDVKQTITRITVGGLPAIRLDYSYLFDGDPAIEEDVILVGPRSVRSIMFTSWKDSADQGRQEFEKCLHSLKYVPESEDKFGRPKAAAMSERV